MVIVRAGDNSLHPGWLASGRNWNILVSGYGESPPSKEHADIVHHFRGGKWDGIYDAIRANEEYVFSHERIMLADDDLRMRADDISAAFAIGAKLDLRLYQPSVAGYGSWRHLFARGGCLLRYVSMIEIMMPILHRDILGVLWRDFRQMQSGFGMDLYWGVLAGFPHVAVLDCVPVRHTRPVGGNKRWARDEINRNLIRRCAPRCPPVLIKLAHYFLGEYIAVRDDLRVDYRAFPGRWSPLPDPFSGAPPPSSSLPPWTGHFYHYAAGKDFSVLQKFDRR